MTLPCGLAHSSVSCNLKKEGEETCTHPAAAFACAPLEKMERIFGEDKYMWTDRGSGRAVVVAQPLCMNRYHSLG